MLCVVAHAVLLAAEKLELSSVTDEAAGLRTRIGNMQQELESVRGAKQEAQANVASAEEKISSLEAEMAARGEKARAGLQAQKEAMRREALIGDLWRDADVEDERDDERPLAAEGEGETVDGPCDGAGVDGLLDALFAEEPPDIG